MNTEKFNLEEISNIPEDEFKDKLLDWIEERGVSKSLQSKLRKDLFETFNSTNLGRQISSKYQQSHQIVLSPLILAINTLVAEFLYAQNCHFSLSVFATEVPYKNTLPDFEKMQIFRFSKFELQEIFEALALNKVAACCDETAMLYNSQTKENTLNPSLLYCVLKMLLSKIVGNVPANFEAPASELRVAVDDKKPTDSKNIKNQYLDSKYFKHFTKYLHLLSQHMLEMSKNMQNLKKSKNSTPQSSEKVEHLNRKLDKINESLKKLSKSKKCRKVSDIIQSIRQLTDEVGQCAERFDKLSNVIVTNPELKSTDDSNNLSYSDWLVQLKSSKYGQRFLEKLESAQLKHMEKEIGKITKHFREKLQSNRMLMKLHYKQKMLEKLRESLIENNSMTNQCFMGIIDAKLNDLKMEKRLQDFNVQEKIILPENSKNADIQQPPSAENKTPNTLVDPKPTYLNDAQPAIRPNLSDNNTTSFLHSPTEQLDQMVEIAKNRLKDLENESEELDKAYQLYLRKQDEKKKKLENGATKIWDNYNKSKTILNTVVVPATITPTNYQSLQLAEYIPTNSFGNDDEEISSDFSDKIKFSNPFVALKNDLLLTKFGLIENSPKIESTTTKSTNKKSKTFKRSNVEKFYSDSTSSFSSRKDNSKPRVVSEILKNPAKIDYSQEITILEEQLKKTDRKSTESNPESQILTDQLKRKDRKPLESTQKPIGNCIQSIEVNNSLKKDDNSNENNFIPSKPIESNRTSTEKLNKLNELAKQQITLISPQSIELKEILPADKTDEDFLNKDPIISPKFDRVDQMSTQKFDKIPETNQFYASVRHHSEHEESDDDDRLVISTGKKSSSSDDFWK